MGMRRLLFAVLFLVGAMSSAALGRILPLTAKEVGLMLRSGYSSQTIQQELSVRRFAGSCDPAAEKTLRDAGAAPALIDAIKSGAYQSSPADADAAQQELTLQTQRRALEAEQSRKLNTLYENQLAQQRAAPFKSEPPAFLIDLLKGDLVAYKTGSLVRFDDEAIVKKKLIALYFSAHWCGPCRKFTPGLVEFYNRHAAQHPEFEIVFVSADKSPFGMETYMRETQMPWPAIDFAKLPGKAALKKYGGKSIPCLVVLDPSGKVISDTYAGTDYLGPEKVLADVAAIFAKPPSAAVAAAR
jgi:nucleoredoxin